MSLIDGPQTPVRVVVRTGAGTERTHCNTQTCTYMHHTVDPWSEKQWLVHLSYTSRRVLCASVGYHVWNRWDRALNMCRCFWSSWSSSSFSFFSSAPSEATPSCCDPRSSWTNTVYTLFTLIVVDRGRFLLCGVPQGFVLILYIFM